MNATIRRHLAPLGSLKLTVVLLAMATFLVFAGTVAQVEKSIWTVVDEYFRCGLAWIDLRIFFPRDWDVPGGFWFPGGWLLGGLLFANVLVAHLLRFKVTATGGRLLSGILVLVAGGVFTWLVIAGVFSPDVAATEEAAFWRVLLRLAKGAGAAIILLVACLTLFGRRGGVVLLHGGIILLFIAEFITGTTAVEGRMRINAGESVNYVEHMRMSELVFIDRSDPAQDHVTVIGMDRLREGGVIRDERLPVELEVVEYLPTSTMRDATRLDPNTVNLATVGAGRFAVAVEAPEVSGTDADQTIDIAAAYVKLRAATSGADLGTYLVTPWFDNTRFEHQAVVIDGRRYDIAMRFARTYKPYEIELIEFRHDKYVGTEKPKNFSSLVRVVDREKGVDRTVRIWMNNPLRYAGETFYQSSFEPGKNLTILQVVRNDGWMIPYLSCMLVAVGMTVQMGGHLLRFLRRRLER